MAPKQKAKPRAPAAARPKAAPPSGRRRAVRGGDFLGEGTYGCVFSPPIACADPKLTAGIRPGSVSKVFRPDKRSSAVQEMGFRVKLQQLDPQQRYFLYPYMQCDVTRAAVAKPAQAAAPGKEHEKCSHLRGSDEAVGWTAVVMPGAEKDLLEHVFARKGQLGRRDVVALMLTCFRGIELLADSRQAHQDVKPENIVVVKQADGSYDSRLIDFGFLKSEDEYYKTAVNDFLYESMYPINPPEYRFAKAKAAGAYTLEQEMAFQGEHLKDAALRGVVFDRAYQKSFKRLAEDFSRNAAPTTQERMRAMRAFSKSDVYSLGFAMATLCQYLKPPEADAPGEVAAFNALMHDCMMAHPDDRLSAAIAVERAKDIVAPLAAAAPAPPMQPPTQLVQANLPFQTATKLPAMDAAGVRANLPFAPAKQVAAPAYAAGGGTRPRRRKAKPQGRVAARDSLWDTVSAYFR